MQVVWARCIAPPTPPLLQAHGVIGILNIRNLFDCPQTAIPGVLLNALIASLGQQATAALCFCQPRIVKELGFAPSPSPAVMRQSIRYPLGPVGQRKDNAGAEARLLSWIFR